ncbi:hypothetical protein TNIN_72521 [Trichonephila inaurata madagascariensis]|uniref:Uncharacterized protein n=1 Tax=Trichonephila inaurata madagascariensis TaxID=2747483 RepID=A0A8X7CPI4_9ARAC|nr:hypothetical protein TNIN_72521 [Trichonephila inaurata madagascariensis]
MIMAPIWSQENRELKRRPHETHKWRKRSARQSLRSGPRPKRIATRNSNPESWRSRVQKSNAESRKKPEALFGRSSPFPPRSRAGTTERQALFRRSSFYPFITERQAIPGRKSPYLSRNKEQISVRQFEQRKGCNYNWICFGRGTTAYPGTVR